MVEGGGRRWGAWEIYNSGFYQQIMSMEAVDFSRINQSLYSTMFLTCRNRGKFYIWCLQSDYCVEVCTLLPNRTLPIVQLRDPMAASSCGKKTRECLHQKSQERDGVKHTMHGTVVGAQFSHTARLSICVLKVWWQPKYLSCREGCGPRPKADRREKCTHRVVYQHENG